MIARYDGFSNVFLGHGRRQRDPFANYSFVWGETPLITMRTAENMYIGNAIARKIASAPADEATRGGFCLKDGERCVEDERKILSVYEDLGGEEAFAEALSWDRLYGGGAILMLINDGGTLEDPVNEAGIKNIEALQVFDPMDVYYSGNYFYQDPSSPKYGRPQYYTVINYHGNSFLVHESRLLLFRGGAISNRERRVRDGWGMKVFEGMAQELINYGGGHSLAMMILSRLSQSVIKFNGLANKLMTEDGEKQVQRRLQLIDMARHLLNTLALDKEDEYDLKNITTAGVKDILNEFSIALSAASEIPATILFGRSPAGENSTGKADFENYYNLVGKIQRRTLKPRLARLIHLIGLASDYQIRLPETYTLTFPPLWLPSEKEQAEADNLKAQAERNTAEARKVYHEMGALDAIELRDKLEEEGVYPLDRSLDPQPGEPEDEPEIAGDYPLDEGGRQSEDGKDAALGNKEA